MSDYNTVVGISRDKMAEMLCNDDEHLIYVITSALNGNIDDALEMGQIDPDADNEIDRGALVLNLRAIANAIEDGQI
jgi:hypothetical protein